MLQPDGEPGPVADGADRRSSTPGANDARSSESCRIVRVSPGPPSMTSWCATRPAHPQPVHPHAVDVGAAGAVEPAGRRVGHGGLPASRRAAATSSAVRRAVPDGASALSGWCSSTISTDSKNGAASAANRIISTAPIEKLGATSTPTCGRVGEQRAQRSQPLLVEPGRADHRVDAVLDAERAGCP